jgi:hypothetical protein
MDREERRGYISGRKGDWSREVEPTNKWIRQDTKITQFPKDPYNSGNLEDSNTT